MYPIQNTALISELLYPLLQKQTIVCVISIQVLSWTYRICQPVKDVRHLSLDYSYDNPQMQWFSNCVSKSPLKYLTNSHQAGMNDKSMGYHPVILRCISLYLFAYFHPISNSSWKIKTKETKTKKEKKKDLKHRWGTQTKSFE